MLKSYKIIKLLFLSLITLVFVVVIGGVPGYSKSPPKPFQPPPEEHEIATSTWQPTNRQPSTLTLAGNPSALEQQAQQLYEAGQFGGIPELLKQAVTDYADRGDGLGQARALRNLALTYQQLGDLSLANKAIADSLNHLQTGQNLGSPAEVTRLLAQVLDVRGQLQLSAGQSEQALETWKQATTHYQKIGDVTGTTRSQINQAQALQVLGLYNQALRSLSEVRSTLQEQPDSLLKAKGLQSLGEALRVVGRLAQSQDVLQQSLAVAEQLQARDSIAATLISLGNTAKIRSKPEEALGFYQRAAQDSPSLIIQIQAQLNQLRVLLDQKRWSEARSLTPRIQSEFASLPPSRTAIYARINLAESLWTLETQESGVRSQESEELLTTAIQQAQSLGDSRAEAYALGNLGGVYEQNKQWDKAQPLTEKALLLAQAINAGDIAYQWQWQLGRLLQARGNTERAIAAYSEAVETLQSLRSDLVSISSDVQFSFRESVEPVYRELVSLLLLPKAENNKQDNLLKAREVIESLQLAELDNFFRDACLDAQPTQIDQIDRNAAVIYPIILSDRLEVIVALPGQSLRQYTTFLPREEIEDTLKDLRNAVIIPRLQLSVKRFLTPAQKVYDWLIRPVEADLAASGIKTLALVPDGSLRNIPIAALHDGQQYLIQKYSVAIAPGLQLVDPQPLARQDLQILAFGLTEARQNFPALPSVKSELESIQAELPSQVLLNEAFTDSNFRKAIASYPFPVVHLATHGEFSSEAEDTFVLTWDDRITAKDFSDLLSLQERRRTRPIELLVLSACQTAAGDDRAALGLAGVAVRAGARSTLASLWFVSDEATSLLMTQFYEELTNSQVTKAEALRRAQEIILQREEFSHPYFWSAFVLVGNWL